MASSLQLFILSLLIFLSIFQAKSENPKTLVLPISKDHSTLQYLAHLHLGTPLKPTNLVLDLGGRYLWIDCKSSYNSSSYRPGHCGSASCSLAKSKDCFYCYSTPPMLGCTKNTCRLDPQNTITGANATEELATDIISLPSINNKFYKITNFIFSCSGKDLLDGLASGAKGMLGLGRTKISLPNQLPNLRQRFALCLPSTSKANGVIFFGDAPYTFYPSYNKSKFIDVSRTLTFSYTKLYINPVSLAKEYYKGRSSAEYFIGVRSIMINRKIIPIKSTLLSINSKGHGGTKISTVNPYTVLESSIYKVFSETFTKELNATKVTKVPPVAPFTECYSTKILGFRFVGSTPLGAVVPEVRFGFENKNVYWKLSGANSMLQISRDTVCLGFLDGGRDSVTPIVLGAHQLEDYLLEFDLAASKMGFSSSILWKETQCTNFKF